MVIFLFVKLFLQLKLLPIITCGSLFRKHQALPHASFPTLLDVGKSCALNLLQLIQPVLQSQNLESFQTALGLFKQSQADFADCVILVESQHVQTMLYTFDKRLGKHPDTSLI